MTSRLDVLTAALVVAAVASGEPCPGSVNLHQGWECETQVAFWHTSQGSLLLPAPWFLVLEQEKSTDPFIDPDHIRKYKYLLPSIQNPANFSGKLPIGFARAMFEKKEYVGMTCAACHTGQITWKKHTMLVEGGPAMADFEGFVKALVASLDATLLDKGKLARFMASVQSPKPSAGELKTWAEGFRTLLNQAGPHTAYGFGRVDAFGYIFNRITKPPMPAIAPVSYPHLWTTPRLDRVQWNGVANNKIPLGPLLRNTGEVLGVFAQFDPTKRGASGIGYRSSVDKKGLEALEGWVSQLSAPKWPDLGEEWKVGTTTEGEKTFKDRCSSCHGLMTDDGTGTKPYIPVKLVPLSDTETQPDTRGSISTDQTMAKRYVTRSTELTRFAGGKPWWYLLLSEPSLLARLNLTGAIVLSLAGQSGAVEEELLKAAVKMSTPGFVDDPVGLLRITKKPEYRGRPLNGIWATAPYLHNGGPCPPCASF